MPGKGKARRARNRHEQLTYSPVHNLLRTANRRENQRSQCGPVKVIVKDGVPVEGQPDGQPGTTKTNNQTDPTSLTSPTSTADRPTDDFQAGKGESESTDS